MKSLKAIVFASLERAARTCFATSATTVFAWRFGFRLKFILALRKLEFIMDWLFRALFHSCSLTINLKETFNNRLHPDRASTGFRLPFAS